jgi:hypothetical protein
MKQNANWPDSVRLKMIEKSEHYDNPQVYQYGYYDGYQEAHQKEAGASAGVVEEWEKALVSLTPGGSEFCGDAAYCVKYVKEFQASQHKMIAQLIKEKKSHSTPPVAVEGAGDEWQEQFLSVLENYKNGKVNDLGLISWLQYLVINPLQEAITPTPKIEEGLKAEDKDLIIHGLNEGAEELRAEALGWKTKYEILHGFFEKMEEYKALPAAGEGWVIVGDGMPEYDGDYLCFINQPQECGNVWQYQQVIKCVMNNWVTDFNETVTHWRYLPSAPPIKTDNKQKK